MVFTESQIKTKFTNYINNNGGSANTWYVGITNYIDRRLFTEHGVANDNGLWIYEPTSDDSVARSIEKHFTDAGLDGAGGGGDDDSTYVYAYKKTTSTIP